MRQRRARLCCDSKHRSTQANKAGVARSMERRRKTQKMPLKKTRRSVTPQHAVRLVFSIGLMTAHSRSVSFIAHVQGRLRTWIIGLRPIREALGLAPARSGDSSQIGNYLRGQFL